MLLETFYFETEKKTKNANKALYSQVTLILERILIHST